MHAHQRFSALRVILTTFLVVLIIIPWSVEPAHAEASWYVTPSGSDNNSCTSPASPCATINAAILKASAGDTIFVSSGVYLVLQGCLAKIDRNLHLLGGWDSTFSVQDGISTIDGTYADPGATHAGICTDLNVTATVDNFMVQHIPPGNDGTFVSGIGNFGTLTLNSMVVSDNSTQSSGGGIYNSQTAVITITASTITRNYAFYTGGGISSLGKLTLIDSTVSDNISDYSAGGIYGATYPGFNIIHSVVSHNRALAGNPSGNDKGGGGIYLWTRPPQLVAQADRSSSQTALFPTAIISDSIIMDNYAKINGGGIMELGIGSVNIVDTIISGNSTGGVGGGLYHYDGTLSIAGSRIQSNSSLGKGGGIYFGLGTATFTGNTIRGNSSQDAGGGLYDDQGHLTITNSGINSNTSKGAGGGIYFNYGKLVINNSTISLNSSQDSAGALYFYNGMGLETILSSSTVSHNIAPIAGGIRIIHDGNVRLQNTILAANTGGNSPDCLGGVVSSGYNLIGNPAGCTFTASTGDLQNVSPQLAVLANYVGYNPLLSNSPAIDTGNPAGCADIDGVPLNADQRGMARQGRCDIGAYEYTVPDAPANILAIGGSPQRSQVNTAFKLPLKALILDQFGSPVPGLSVAFTAPATGASGVFQDSGTNSTFATSSDWGVATSVTFSANTIYGVYQVLATPAQSPASGAFLLTNTDMAYLPMTNCKFCTNFFDNFSDPSSGWWVGEDSYVRNLYLNGEYQVLAKQSYIFYFYRSPSCDRENFIIEADMRWSGKLEGDSYGLIFGLTGNFEHFYVFDINTAYQMYRLYRVDGDFFTLLDGPTGSSAIHSGNNSNHLKATRDGSTITLEVNGTVLGSWSDGTISGMTRAGIMVSTANLVRVDARFDNFSSTNIPASSDSGVLPLPSSANLQPFPGLKLDRKTVSYNLGW